MWICTLQSNVATTATPLEHLYVDSMDYWPDVTMNWQLLNSYFLLKVGRKERLFHPVHTQIIPFRFSLISFGLDEDSPKGQPEVFDFGFPVLAWQYYRLRTQPRRDRHQGVSVASKVIPGRKALVLADISILYKC